jgi:hypothetical protein
MSFAIGLGWLGAGIAISFAMIPIGQIAFPPNSPPDGVAVSIGLGNSLSDDLAERMKGGVPYITLYDTAGRYLDWSHNPERGIGPEEDFNVLGSSVTRVLVTKGGHPEYMKVTASGENDACISHILITDKNNFFAWTGSLAKLCGYAGEESDALVPLDGPERTTPCIWISGKKDSTYPKAFSVRLLDMAYKNETVANTMAEQYNKDKDSLCKAPARMQFWKDTKPTDCIPYYAQPIIKNAQGGDKFPDQILHGHAYRDNCHPGIPFDNADSALHPKGFQPPNTFGGDLEFADFPFAAGFEGFGYFETVEEANRLADESDRRQESWRQQASASAGRQQPSPTGDTNKPTPPNGFDEDTWLDDAYFGTDGSGPNQPGTPPSSPKPARPAATNQPPAANAKATVQKGTKQPVKTFTVYGGGPNALVKPTQPAKTGRAPMGRLRAVSFKA